ncbi:MAG: hypothetical protein QOC98_627 [Frankiaceae bacterium]|nr:hypothetical protein [Frankiaceae bacterium]
MTVRQQLGTVSAALSAAVLALLLLIAVGGAATAATAPSAPPAPAPSAAAGSSSSTDLAQVSAALGVDPLYVSTAPGTPPVAAGDVRGALPTDVYVAVLPPSAAGQVGGETAALPGAILARLTRPGTVLVLVGNTVEGASRTQNIDRLQQVLNDARTRLRAGDAPASVLVVASRGLTGSAQLSDAPSATRAGSPAGGGFLFVVIAGVVVALASIPILLRRARRPAVEPPPTVLRDRVEIDAYGRVVRRLSAEELADRQERRGR